MDILKSDLIRCPYKTASLLSHQYFNTLRSLLDKHAPMKRKKYRDMPRLGSRTATSSRPNDSRGNMRGHGTVKTLPEIIADTAQQSITILSCLRSSNAIIIPTSLLKIKEILRLCGTVSKRFYTGPLMLFYQTVQIKLTLQTLSISSSVTKSLK